MTRMLMIVALLSLTMSNAFSAEPGNRMITELRVEGYGLATQLLLNYNPNIGKNSRALPLTFYVSGYREWQSALSGLGRSQLSSEFDTIFSSLQKLNMLDDDQVSMLPSILNPILKAHDQVDQALRSKNAFTDPIQAQLDQQRIDIARLGLYYQTRLFNGLRSFTDASRSGDPLTDTDAKINDRFLLLDKMINSGDVYLARSRTNYDFVRKPILEVGEGWIPEAALLYLNKSIESLSRVRP